jgi:CheY-like chemotaxis protein
VKPHVLVVDDDLDVRESIAELLGLEGLEVSVARDGREALERLRSGAALPSLVLLDLMMPRMNGWELLEHLRGDAALRSIPVCTVSASGAPAPPGAQHALHKPFHAEALLEVVARFALERRKARVLVVDDEPLVTAAIRRALRGHDVTTCDSGREVLRLVADGARYDVLLCDLMMPAMSGVELHASLAEAVPDQAERMVFVTGGAFTGAARAFLDRVPNERIEKPFDVGAIRSLVERFVKER